MSYSQQHEVGLLRFSTTVGIHSRAIFLHTTLLLSGMINHGDQYPMFFIPSIIDSSSIQEMFLQSLIGHCLYYHFRLFNTQ